MKKIIVLIVVSMPLLLFGQIDSLRGNVKSIREKLIFLDSNIQNLKFFSTENEYGHYGFVSPEFTTKRFNSLWTTTTFSHYVNFKRDYDTAKNLIAEEWYFEDGGVVERYKYEYDKFRNLTQTTIYFNDSSFFIRKLNYAYDSVLYTAMSFYSDRINDYNYTVNEYDSSRYLIETKDFGVYGENYTTKYYYTSSHKLRETRVHYPYVWEKVGKTIQDKKDKIGVEILQEERIYDSNDNLIELRKYNPNAYRTEVALGRKEFYKYDKLNRKIEENYSDTPTSKRLFRDFKYDEAGLLTQERFVKNSNEILNSSEYLYDRNRNLTELCYFREGSVKSTARFQYKFDKSNNWVEQLKIVDGQPLYLRKRTIIYY